ncbi:MAG: thiamine pyrophosphate-dependent enzyme [Sulfolobaceae archaeon]
MKIRYGETIGTDFSNIDYMKIAEGFGLSGYRISNNQEIGEILRKAMKNTPSLVEVIVKPEDKLIPPVSQWVRSISSKDMKKVVY